VDNSGMTDPKHALYNNTSRKIWAAQSFAAEMPQKCRNAAEIGVPPLMRRKASAHVASD
jgi:hypothetical protein